MSPEEKRQIAGEVLLEAEESRKELVFLRAKADLWLKHFDLLRGLLQNAKREDEEQQAKAKQLRSEISKALVESKGLISVDAVFQLDGELEAAFRRATEMAEKKRKLGYS